MKLKYFFTTIVLFVAFILFKGLNLNSKVLHFNLDNFLNFNNKMDITEVKLNIISEFFDDGNGPLNAIQGLDGTSEDYKFELFIANGYKNSLGYINFKNLLLTKKIKNQTKKGGIELLADVYFRDTESIFWTSYRNSFIYKSNDKLKLSKEIFAKNFNNPIGISGNNNQIVVADYDNHEVVSLNNNGKEIWRKKYYINFKLQKSPYGVTLYKNSIFISFNFHENFKIMKLDLDGRIKKISKPIKINGLSVDNLQGIDVDSKGQLYVHDTGNKRILLFDKDLSILRVLKHNAIKIGRGLTILEPDNLLVISGFKKNRKISSKLSGFWIFDKIKH